MSSHDESGPEQPPARVNWLFSGAVLGAASWLLILGIVFASLSNWLVAGVLFGGMCVCGLAIWRASRRLAQAPDLAQGRHRAIATKAEAA